MARAYYVSNALDCNEQGLISKKTQYHERLPMFAHDILFIVALITHVHVTFVHCIISFI